MKNWHIEEKLKKGLAGILLPLLLLAGSVFIAAPKATNPESFDSSIQMLEEKEKTVLELTAASTAASLAASALPGDMGTPVANKMADLSTGFLAVLCVLFLEKYLLTITGFAAFRVLIPVSCVFWILFTLWGKEKLGRIGQKLFLFALAVFCLVPASIFTSNMIENTYEASIQETLDDARELPQELEEETPAEDSGDKKWYEAAGEWFDGVKEEVGGTVTGWVDKAEKAATGILEALAVMLVTSCLIPLLVVLVFIWLFKMVFAVEIPLVNAASMRRKGKKEAAHVSQTDD